MRATDLLIVAVPDDALAGVVSGLARMGALQPGQIVAHTSGAHGLDVLAPAIGRRRPAAGAASRDDLHRDSRPIWTGCAASPSA